MINDLKRNKLNMIVHCKLNDILNFDSKRGLLEGVEQIPKKKKENLPLYMKLNADYKYTTMYQV